MTTGGVSDELREIGQYFRSVAKYWWLIVVGLGLTLLDFAERLLGTWWIIPRPAWVVIGVVCLAVAQYLTYRDLRKANDKHISDQEISLRVENDGLRQGVPQLERKIARLEEENAKLRVKPYDEAQRQHVHDKLNSYSDSERDLLRFLIQRGETEGSLIYRACQEGRDSCDRALQRLAVDGMILLEVDAARSHFVAVRCYRINPTFEDALRDLLYPRAEAQVTPRFLI